MSIPGRAKNAAEDGRSGPNGLAEEFRISLKK
jgi:hypothetical protein